MRLTLEEVEIILRDYIEGNNLVWQGGKQLEYLTYRSRSKTATLDGDFTALQLAAISFWMQVNE